MREYGDGTVFYSASKGYYVGRINVGFRADGKPKKHETTAKSEKAAWAKLRKVKKQYERTGIVASRITVAAFLDRWLERDVRRRLKPTAIREYESSVRVHIKPRLGRITLANLTREHVEEMHADIAKRVSLATANKVHRALRAALSYAEKRDLVPRNVAKGIDTGAVRPADADLDVADAMLIVKQGIFRWSLALVEGLRQGEGLGLEHDRLDQTERTIDVSWQLQRKEWKHGCADDGGKVCDRKWSSKCPARMLVVPDGFERRDISPAFHLIRPKGHERFIPYPDLLDEQIDAHYKAMTDVPDPHGLVFRRADGEPITPEDDWRAWKSLLTDLEIPYTKPHGARHTTATLLMALKVPDEIIRAILGHTTVQTTKGYQHVDLTMMRQALDGLAGTFTEQPTDPDAEAKDAA